MSDLPDGVPPDTRVRSHRDPSLHSDERGFDSKNVQTEPYQDYVGNWQTEAEIHPDADRNTSGLALCGGEARSRGGAFARPVQGRLRILGSRAGREGRCPPAWPLAEPSRRTCSP